MGAKVVSEYNSGCGVRKTPHSVVEAAKPDPNLARAVRRINGDLDMCVIWVVFFSIMSGLFIGSGLLGKCKEGDEFKCIILGIMSMCVALSLYAWWRWDFLGVKKVFAKTLAGLTFDQLKVELEAHPEWLKFLPDHTEEMALIAIAADPNVVKHTRHTRHRSESFWMDVLKINPAIVAKQFNGGNLTHEGVCRVWREILKADPQLFVREAPIRFHHLEYEIYFDLVSVDHSYIHRVPTIELQNRIRAELNIV